MSETSPTTAARAPSRFPATFWVANVMELFERAAYYGMNSVLAVYLTTEVSKGGLGFREQSVGFLQSIVYAATYVFPILGGALADRYGYRRMLLVAFSLLATGYFAAGHMSSYALVFLALLVMATGSGLFKPIISGTVARTTDETNSALGFGLYYWMINLGAFLAPFVVSWLKGFSWQYVFTASAIYTGLMLLPTAFVFRDPPRPESTKGLGAVLRGAAEVLADARFMLMVVVYSGFWILYFQTFGSVLWYLRDFVDRGPVSELVTSLLARIGIPVAFHFDVEHVTVINAGTIILLQVPVSRIVRDWKALPTMVTGMVLGGVGFLLLASSMSPWIFILEVLQLHRAGGARRPQGRLHGLRVPLRRVRLAAGVEPGRVPVRAGAQARRRDAGGRGDGPVLLADVRAPRHRGRLRSADLRARLRPRQLRDAAPGAGRDARRLLGDSPPRGRVPLPRVLADPRPAPHGGAGAHLRRAGGGRAARRRLEALRGDARLRDAGDRRSGSGRVVMR